MARYWMQHKAPAGNWVDNVGTDNKPEKNNVGNLFRYAENDDLTYGRKARIVRRIDIEVQENQPDPLLYVRVALAQYETAMRQKAARAFSRGNRAEADRHTRTANEAKRALEGTPHVEIM